MKKYAIFNEDNSLAYICEFEGKDIPKNFVDVTDITEEFNARDENGNFIYIEPVKDPKEELKILIETVTHKIEAIVQNEINKYNEVNNMQFNNIDTIAKYISFPEYTHHAFVKQILEFNMQIWEKAREVQGQVLAGQLQISSIEDLLPLLPKFTFKEEISE